jgi:hypothetical protein
MPSHITGPAITSGKRHMNKAILLIALLVLASCAAVKEQQQTPASQCKWPEIPNDGGCCRDMNENGICDTVEFSQQIATEQQKEYDEAAIKAQITANRSGRYRPTIVNELYANASAIKSYRFYYKGDEIVVANGSVMRRLTLNYPLGDQTVQGRRMKVFVNTVWLDFINKTASAQCIPPAILVIQKQSTPCDDIIGINFSVDFDAFAFKMPILWLEEFLYRTPAEVLPGSHIAKRSATMLKFTSLQDSTKITTLWIDEQTGIPLRTETARGNTILEKDDYQDFYTI